jgi:RND superfamily putative drug exporter
LNFDPVSPKGKEWLLSARATLRRIQSEGMNYNFYLSGIAADTHDTITAVYDAFPLMISITGGLVLLFVGIAFKSIIIPIRSVLTIALTIIFVYGFATLVYQYGILNWIHLPGLSSEPSQALVSLIPIIAFSIVVGVALDYDIFLLVRVREFRLSAHSTNESIARGLYKTGSIITAAGVFMFLAFGGLLFSHCALINQLAFFLSIAVLVDTFVVRALIVPAVMGIFGDANWWPISLPTHSSGAESVKLSQKQLF